MSDRFDLDRTQSTRKAFSVTPSDSASIEETRGLYIGTAGTIRVLHVDDTVPTDYPTTIAGSVYPWAVKKVYATGTTATDIRAQL